MMKKIIKALQFRINYILYLPRIISIFKRKRTNMVVLLASPYHRNAGDLAQTVCTLEWIKKNYPSYDCIDLYDSFLERHECFLLKAIKKYISSEDILILHSGYHTTDLYPVEERIQRYVLKNFENNQILIFPQTVHFLDDNYRKDVINDYNKNKNVLMLCRDKVSFENACEMFSSFRIELYPDIVTSLIGTQCRNLERKGIFLCFREGLEVKIKEAEKQLLRREVEKIDRVVEGDTELMEPLSFVLKKRTKLVIDYICMLSKYKLVITDRYHGMIFSLAACTPVIVLPTTDHKLSAGYEWFKDVEKIKDYIFYEESVEEVLNLAHKIYDTSYEYELPPYYQHNYFDNLKEVIDSGTCTKS